MAILCGAAKNSLRGTHTFNACICLFRGRKSSPFYSKVFSCLSVSQFNTEVRLINSCKILDTIRKTAQRSFKINLRIVNKRLTDCRFKIQFCEGWVGVDAGGHLQHEGGHHQAAQQGGGDEVRRSKLKFKGTDHNRYLKRQCRKVFTTCFFPANSFSITTGPIGCR